MTAELLTSRTLGGLRVQPVQDREPFVNVLIYGDPGVGKTVDCGSADAVPEMRSVIGIDVEGGTFSLRALYPNVEIVRVQNFKELQLVYNELHRGGHGYHTVFLDSLTEIQKFSMYGIMEDAVEAGRKDGKPVDPDVPSMREWGKNIEQIRKFVRAFRDLPMNTIFTALAKSDKDMKTGSIKTKPYLSGKLADEVAGFLDIVTYQYTKMVAVNGETVQKRYMLTGATDQYVAKDRSGRLPLVIEEPDMTKLYNHIHGNEAETTQVKDEA